MELIPCPSCGAFSATEKTCSNCHAALPDEPVAAAEPPIVFALAEEEPAVKAAASAEESPAVEAALPPFDGPAEVKARIGKLEGEIAQKPSAPALSLQLAKVYVEANRTDLAVAVLRQFLDRDPKNPYVRHKLAQLTGTAEAGAAAPPSRTGQTAAYAMGHAVRPPAAPIPNLMRRMPPRTRAAIAGVLAALLLGVAAKVWLFPSTVSLVAGEFRAYAPVWSPTGRHLAFLLDDGKQARIAVYDFGAKAVRPLAPASAGDARSFAWSPDGLHIAYTATGSDQDYGETVHVVDVATGQIRPVAAGALPTWSADGQSLLMTCAPEPPVPGAYDDGASFAQFDGTPRFCTVDAATGAARRSQVAADSTARVSPLLEKAVYERHQGSEDEPEGAAAQASRTGDGEFQDLAQAVAEGEARNFAEGSKVLNRELEARQYMEKRESARGASRLPYRADVVVTDLGSGAATSATSDGAGAFPSWTPDGARILFATNGPSGIEMWTMNPDGGDRLRVVGGALKVADPSSVVLSADGKLVFFIAPVEGDEGVAKLMTGESPADLFMAGVGEERAERLSNRHPYKQRFAVSPDGKRIAYEVLQEVTMLGGAKRSEIWLLKR